MNSKIRTWAGIVAAGTVAAFIAFGAGGMSGDSNSVQAGMTRSSKGDAGAPSKSSTGGGKSSQGVAHTGSGNGI